MPRKLAIATGGGISRLLLQYRVCQYTSADGTETMNRMDVAVAHACDLARRKSLEAALYKNNYDKCILLDRTTIAACACFAEEFYER